MRIAYLIAALIALKTLVFAVDDTVRVYLGDSGAYLHGALDDGRLPDDRSFTYSFIIRALAYPHKSVRVLIQWQTVAGVGVALILYVILVRRFGVPPLIASIAACVVALEPAQLYYERMVLAETFGLLAFVLFFAACCSYLASGRAWWLPVAALFGLAAVSLRLNFLPIVLVISPLLPALRMIARPDGVDARPKGPAFRSRWRRDLIVAIGSVALLHGGYCYWVAQIFNAPPGYLGRAGFMRLGLVLPLVQPQHFSELGLTEIERRLDYPIDDPHARMPHLWAPGGLVFEMRNRNLDVDRLSRELSRRALLHDPFGLVRIGLITLGDYFRPDEIEHALHNDLGRREIPYDMLWNLREYWGYDATDLDTRVTFVSRAFEWGTWWLVGCLLALPLVSVLNLTLHWATPYRAHALLAALFGVGLFLAHVLFVPVAFYRYLHPLPFFVCVNAIPLGLAVASRLRRNRTR